MAINRLHYVYKLNSSWVKENQYKVNLSIEQALKSQKMCTLSSNKVIRIINKLVGRTFTKDELENLFEQKKKLSRMKNNRENKNKLRLVNKHIYDLLTVPELCILTMEVNSDYDNINKKGLYINNKKYVRLSCSAGNARQKKVIFVTEELYQQIVDILDNGRDKSIPFIPSKYNAYFGLNTSATKVVTYPRMCVIPDSVRNEDTQIWWVDENSNWNEDDTITKQIKNLEFNNFDGMGLVSPTMAAQWQQDLEIDYLPSEFIVRSAFIKGMCCVFDFQEWCKECNNDNYMVDTVYKDENGQAIKVDLRNIDVILTESQFKLWNSYKNFDEYLRLSDNGYKEFGIAMINAKQDKDILFLNYQFIQTLNLNKEDVKELCNLTENYFTSVSSENVDYTLLFMLGADVNNEQIDNLIQYSDNYMLKSLLVNHKLIDDKYIRSKIYDSIVNRLNQSCMGKIYVRGNFQTLVSDPYALMEFAVGKTPKGLLDKGEFYSRYWVDKGVKVVDSMRSPLTYLSEHLICNIKNNDKMSKWYKYLQSGFICNIHDEHCMRYAGSDYDGDIIASTDNEIMIKGVYKNDIPVAYEAPHGEKKIFTKEDLINSDKFAFGSIIGQLTNKVTLIRTMMSNWDESSEEYNILINRMRMGCKMQSAQIDKAKIGREVKGIPSCWTKWNKIDEDDSEEDKYQKQLLNNVVCDKVPYFFTYLYDSTNKDYKKYFSGYAESCKVQFNMTIEQLQLLENKTQEQIEFLDKFKRFNPVIDNNSVMNMLCHYMEGVKSNIQFSKSNASNDCMDLMYRKEVNFSKTNYNKVFNAIQEFVKELKMLRLEDRNGVNANIKTSIDNLYEYLSMTLFAITNDGFEITNYMLDIFYNKCKSLNKNILWKICGQYIFENICWNSCKNIYIPMQDDNGDIEYLGKNYILVPYTIDNLKKKEKENVENIE